MMAEGVREDPKATEPTADTHSQRVPPEKIGTLLSRLVDDTERFVRAEIRLYRAQAIIRLIQVRAAVIMAGIGAVLMLSTAIALQVGLILVLIPYGGRIAAVAIVVVASLLAAWILFHLALKTLRKVTEVAPGKDETDS